ncbi:MAG: NAD kinase [Alphaproteobacteria bacterium]|nr:MAG: NAD kinase [Alphaproteobacteria bacterium]
MNQITKRLPPRMAILASPHAAATRALTRLTERYGQCTIDQADILVALGGDGFVLETLHNNITQSKPVFGMRRGSVGFLCNEYREDDLIERVSAAQEVALHALRMQAWSAENPDAPPIEALALNEVSLWRESRQAAKLRVSVDGVVRLEEMISDGIIVATPAGSTAYNFSAHGTILPLEANMLALTPINPFRPRRWRGALVAARSEITIEVLEPSKRPVSAAADITEARRVGRVQVSEDRSLALNLLFDPEHSLAERILREQFQS